MDILRIAPINAYAFESEHIYSSLQSFENSIDMEHIGHWKRHKNAPVSHWPLRSRAKCCALMHTIFSLWLFSFAAARATLENAMFWCSALLSRNRNSLWLCKRSDSRPRVDSQWRLIWSGFTQEQTKKYISLECSRGSNAHSAIPPGTESEYGDGQKNLHCTLNAYHCAAV